MGYLLSAPGKKLRRKKTVTSSMVGLEFPVGTVALQFAKGKYGKRVAVDVPVYMTAVLEYLATEVLELAGNAAKDDNKTLIDSTHLQIPATKDQDLNKLFGDLAISNTTDAAESSNTTKNNNNPPAGATSQISLPMDED